MTVGDTKPPAGALASHREAGFSAAEEVRAWTIGHEMQEDLGFEDFACYAERERTGLHFHRYRLGIEDLWEDEVS